MDDFRLLFCRFSDDGLETVVCADRGYFHLRIYCGLGVGRGVRFLEASPSYAFAWKCFRKATTFFYIKASISDIEKP